MYGLWILLAGERNVVKGLDELLVEVSSLELSVVRVSELVEGVLFVLNPRLWRKFSSDWWGVIVSFRVGVGVSILGMRGKHVLWVFM